MTDNKLVKTVMDAAGLAALFGIGLLWFTLNPAVFSTVLVILEKTFIGKIDTPLEPILDEEEAE